MDLGDPPPKKKIPSAYFFLNLQRFTFKNVLGINQKFKKMTECDLIEIIIRSYQNKNKRKNGNIKTIKD